MSSVHRHHQLAQRHRDRAQDQQGQKGADHDRRDDHDARDAGRLPGFADDALAGRARLAGQTVGDRRQKLVGGDAVQAGMRQQRVAGDPTVVGVFVDGLMSELFILRELGADTGHGKRLALGQRVEMLLHLTARRRGIALG